MYDSLVQWIGSNTCNLAGDVGTVLNAGYACASGQALNMGIVVLSIAVFGVAVMVINARRRQRRDRYFQ
jgi:hypothetical protein